jgi:hypothetical protein
LYLLYLDESGNPDDAQDKHFVLAGAAVFERVAFFLSRSIDAVQTTHFPGVQPIAFHATDIRSGNGFWRNIPKDKRAAVLADLAKALAETNHPGMFLFAAVVEKTAALYGENAVKAATEEICRRFDIFLMRQFHQFNDPQRGIATSRTSPIQGPTHSRAADRLDHTPEVP